MYWKTYTGLAVSDHFIQMIRPTPKDENSEFPFSIDFILINGMTIRYANYANEDMRDKAYDKLINKINTETRVQVCERRSKI